MRTFFRADEELQDEGFAEGEQVIPGRTGGEAEAIGLCGRVWMRRILAGYLLEAQRFQTTVESDSWHCMGVGEPANLPGLLLGSDGETSRWIGRFRQ
jgi:hypothetical protein